MHAYTFFDPCRTAAAPPFRACNSRHNSDASRGGGLQASVEVTARTLVNARGLALSRLSQRIAVLFAKATSVSLSFPATLGARIERFPKSELAESEGKKKGCEGGEFWDLFFEQIELPAKSTLFLMK